MYGKYSDILSDPELDIVYIATPHSFHFENSIMCLEKGIPVLCEKPITINYKQLKSLVDLARYKKVFLMEAIMTRFLPTIETTVDIINSGELGEIKVINADFGFRADYNPESRLFNPSLGGGCLLDIGIYPVFLSLLLLGYPDEIKAVCFKAKTGVDESMAISMRYNSGAVASLHCTFTAHTEVSANIYCEKGKIRINPRWTTLSSLSVQRDNQDIEEKKFNYDLNGYDYEANEVMSCLNKGLTESPKLNLEFSLELMKLLDEIRRICGISYPLYD
jgi:predicted dehydrogenase